jgi:hypothetical protein
LDVLDRLSYLLRNVLDEPISPSSTSGGSRAGAGAADPDWRAAWNELDEYMREASISPEQTDGGRWSAASGAGADTRRGRSVPPSGIPRSLEKDFAALEVPLGAPLEEVRSGFRKELRRYHPDRFAGDPEKFKAATAVTRELIQAYRRIRDFYGAAE